LQTPIVLHFPSPFLARNTFWSAPRDKPWRRRPSTQPSRTFANFFVVFPLSNRASFSSPLLSRSPYPLSGWNQTWNLMEPDNSSPIVGRNSKISGRLSLDLRKGLRSSEKPSQTAFLLEFPFSHEGREIKFFFFSFRVSPASPLIFKS